MACPTVPKLLKVLVSPPPPLSPESPLPIAPIAAAAPPSFFKLNPLPPDECFFGFGAASAAGSATAVSVVAVVAAGLDDDDDEDDDEVDDELVEELEGELEEFDVLVSVDATDGASSALPRSLLEPFELTTGFEGGAALYRDFADLPVFVWLLVLEVESELNVLDDGAELGDVEEDDEEDGDVYVFISVNLIPDFPG